MIQGQIMQKYTYRRSYFLFVFLNDSLFAKGVDDCDVIDDAIALELFVTFTIIDD